MAIERGLTIGELNAMVIHGAATPGAIHRNKRIIERIGAISDAVANVIDKLEHGDNEVATIEKYARIAGCTEKVLRIEVANKRDFDRDVIQ